MVEPLTFVLVPGAWHGGWCWKKLVPLLEAPGHRVIALTLTGLGDRSHLISPSVDLTTHMDDVVNTLEMEGLGDVILVGHSYGGMVITGVAARAAERIRRLVYLDALVPEAGQSTLDLLPTKLRQRLEADAATLGDGSEVPPIIEISGVTDPDDLAWMRLRLRAHPLASFLQPVPELTGAALPPSTYIACGQFILHETAMRCRAKGWEVLEIDCGHDAMIIKPRELADLLLSPDCTGR